MYLHICKLRLTHSILSSTPSCFREAWTELEDVSFFSVRFLVLRPFWSLSRKCWTCCLLFSLLRSISRCTISELSPFNNYSFRVNILAVSCLFSSTSVESLFQTVLRVFSSVFHILAENEREDHKLHCIIIPVWLENSAPHQLDPVS